MLLAQLRFVPTAEDADGNGWEVSLGDEQDVPTVTFHASITLAHAAILTAFQADNDVINYFTQEAEGTVLGSNSGAVASELATLLSAEGL